MTIATVIFMSASCPLPQPAHLSLYLLVLREPGLAQRPGVPGVAQRKVLPYLHLGRGVQEDLALQVAETVLLGFRVVPGETAVVYGVSVVWCHHSPLSSSYSP